MSTGWDTSTPNELHGLISGTEQIKITSSGVNIDNLTNTNGIVFTGTSGLLSNTTVGTVGQVLTSNGSGNAPTFQAGGSGSVATVGTINSQTKSTDGAVISGTEIVFQTADATNVGLLSTGTQTIAGAKTFSGTLNNSTLTASQAIVTDGSKNLVSKLYSSGSSASSIASRDVNGVSGFTNVNIVQTSTATSGQTVALTYGSAGYQRVTGTSTITFKMPDCTYLVAGWTFQFNNNSIGLMTIQDFGANGITTVPAGGYMMLICLSNATSNGLWDFHAILANMTTSGTSGTSFPGTITASGLTNTNGVLYAGASGLISNTTVGTVGQVLTSNGSGNAPTFQAGGIGGLTPPLITQKTATGTQTGIFITGTSISANAGDTYTNNGHTYTVQDTVLTNTYIFMSGALSFSGANFIRATGSGTDPIIPASVSTTGTFTTSTSPATLYMTVQVIGGGGGGSGSGSGASDGFNGLPSCFDRANCLCYGGDKGRFNITSGAAGGSALTGGAALVITGATGNVGQNNIVAVTQTASIPGAAGTATYFGGGGCASIAGANAIVFGTGGGGGGLTLSASTGTFSTGNAGGAGAYVSYNISSPAATYNFMVGQGGSSGGAGGGTGNSGGSGKSGLVLITEYFQ